MAVPLTLSLMTAAVTSMLTPPAVNLTTILLILCGSTPLRVMFMCVLGVVLRMCVMVLLTAPMWPDMQHIRLL